MCDFTITHLTEDFDGIVYDLYLCEHEDLPECGEAETEDDAIAEFWDMVTENHDNADIGLMSERMLRWHNIRKGLLYGRRGRKPYTGDYPDTAEAADASILDPDEEL